MVKRLTLLGFCIVGLLLPNWAQQAPQFLKGPAAVEFLAYASTGLTVSWELQPADPTAQSNFSSPILLSFDIPPSPKSPAIFLGIWGQYNIIWTNSPIRIFNSAVYFRITSPAIPDIEFAQAYSIPPIVSETNNAEDQAYPIGAWIRHKGYCKMPLIRGSLEYWWVYDKSTGQRPADSEILSYINKMIDKGFKVEVWAGGTIQGLSYIAPIAFAVEVDRLMPTSTQNTQR